ncbi:MULTISPECIES: hypothetical protein [unclassified Paenibacillus]|uniref:Uncharacterized protein n=1 Tax=Paenibacillus provencensis TaxID=441151 RepID=A0ABW3Q0T6_9BACL|nr:MULTISPECIES: hypothetical protein [unclassified Paenibacillus]MCM3127135.1 hypothetical protein [Paenibacillus sp. MER 78]
MNNFQDHAETMDHTEVRIELDTGRGIAAFPRQGTLTMRSGMGAVLSFHMIIHDIGIVTATIQPLTKLDNGSGGARIQYDSHMCHAIHAIHE